MYVRHLTLVDFRSWESADLALAPGPVVLLGANGQGKTNLVEAIGYLATLGSHRVAGDAPLVRAGAERAMVQAAVVADDRELRVQVEIVPGRSNRGSLNGAPTSRPRDVLGAVRTVLFAPEDLAVVRGDPGERRRFLDELAVARRPLLAGVRADYERVLKQRSALLKSAGVRRQHVDLSTLDVWDGHLAAHGAQLLTARLETLRAIRPHALAAYAQVTSQRGEFGVRYASSLETDPPLDPSPELPLPAAEALEEALLRDLAAARPAELDRGVNLVGPHRDELELSVNGLPVRGYASHGEGWAAALALRLGSYELLRSEGLSGGDPVLILDDVFAELDADRRAQLAQVAATAEQAIVTAAVPEDVPPELRGRRFRVEAGTVQRAD